MIRKKPTKAIMGTRVEDRPFRYDPHLAWIRKQACVVSGCTERIVRACHVRYGLPPDEIKGTGMKPGDHWTYPACDKHHMEEHNGVESFQRKYGLDLARLAQEYAAASPALRKLKAKQEKGATP